MTGGSVLNAAWDEFKKLEMALPLIAFPELVRPNQGPSNDTKQGLDEATTAANAISLFTKGSDILQIKCMRVYGYVAL